MFAKIFIGILILITIYIHTTKIYIHIDITNSTSDIPLYYITHSFSTNKVLII
jgi:hypothetical protein